MEPISSILFSLYQGTPQHEEWVLACLQGAWRGLVGKTVSDASRPVLFSGSCVTVEAIDAAWLQALEDMKKLLLDRIKTRTNGQVSEIRFRTARE